MIHKTQHFTLFNFSEKYSFYGEKIVHPFIHCTFTESLLWAGVPYKSEPQVGRGLFLP